MNNNPKFFYKRNDNILRKRRAGKKIIFLAHKFSLSSQRISQVIKSAIHRENRKYLIPSLRILTEICKKFKGMEIKEKH